MMLPLLLQYPILFQYGPIRIGSYGVMMALGFLCGIWVLRRELRRRHLNVELADRIALAAMIGGLVGAKVFHLLEYPEIFLADPFGSVFSGYGLAWYGGLIGGAVAVLFTLYRRDALAWRVLDAIAPALVVGYFFGRGGCEVSGDGCYGIPTTLPWGESYPNGIVPTLQHVHPTPIYEMLEMVLIYWVLWALRDRLKSGQIFALYLVLIAIARFAVEFVRRTPKVLLGLSTHQWVSLVLIPLGIYLFIRRRHGGIPQSVAGPSDAPSSGPVSP